MPPLSHFPYSQARRKGHQQPKGRVSPDNNPADALTLDFESPEWWEITSCCLSCLVCGILLGLPPEWANNTWIQLDFVLILHFAQPSVKVSPGSGCLSNTWLTNAAVQKEDNVPIEWPSHPLCLQSLGQPQLYFQPRKTGRESLFEFFPTYHIPAAFNLSDFSLCVLLNFLGNM